MSAVSLDLSAVDAAFESRLVLDRALDLIAELEAIQTQIAGARQRLLAAARDASRSNGDGDRLVDIAEAAKLLAVSPSWIRHRPHLPLIVKLDGGAVRCSVRGIERYIAAEQQRGNGGAR